MKYMITAALALCLIGGAAAAQDRDHDHGGGRGEGRQGGGQEHRGGGPQGGPQGGGHERGGPQGAPQTAPQIGPQGGPGQTHGFRAGPQTVQTAPQPGPGPQVQGGGERRGGEFRGGGPAPGFQGGSREEFRGAERRGGEFRGAPTPGPGFRGEARRGPEPGYRPGYYARDHGYRGGGHFRVAPYRYPVGWGYQRWAFGAFLPFVFLATDYTL
jgi:hypothetical protein